MSYLSFPSPLGDITLFEEGGAIVALEWGRVPDGAETPLLARARAQIEEYFDGTGQAFDLPLDPAGTTHDLKVWRLMLQVPFGATVTYGDIAREIGSGPRAVGTACGRNPIPILIPCHRVLAAGKRLGGYSGHGGLETKQWLLGLEQDTLQASRA